MTEDHFHKKSMKCSYLRLVDVRVAQDRRAAYTPALKARTVTIVDIGACTTIGNLRYAEIFHIIIRTRTKMGGLYCAQRFGCGTFILPSTARYRVEYVVEFVGQVDAVWRTAVQDPGNYSISVTNSHYAGCVSVSIVSRPFSFGFYQY